MIGLGQIELVKDWIGTNDNLMRPYKDQIGLNDDWIGLNVDWIMPNDDWILPNDDWIQLPGFAFSLVETIIIHVISYTKYQIA